MITVDLTDDDGFSAFQFYWFALNMRKRDGETDGRLKREHDLRSRLIPMSEHQQDGGRTLLTECTLTLSEEERFTLLSAISDTQWKPSVLPHVLHAVQRLGFRMVGHRKVEISATLVEDHHPGSHLAMD